MNNPDNVRLEIHSFKLKPNSKSNQSAVCFRDLFLKYTESTPDLQNDDLFKKYFIKLISSLDSHYQLSGTKAFSLLNTNNESSLIVDEHIIYGVIEGGPLGSGKTKSDLNDKTNKTPLDGSVINDQYFFLIYTPLNSDEGIIMFHIYDYESIKREFYNYIFKNIFSIKGYYNSPSYSPIISNNLKEKFKNHSVVKELSFSQKILASSISPESSFTEIHDNYKIEIKITPIKGVEKNQLKSLLKHIGDKLIFNNRIINFDNKKAVLRNKSTKKEASFEIDGIESIMPRIYLKNEGVDINQETGIPNFNSLKLFCLNLLEELKDKNNRSIIDV